MNSRKIVEWYFEFLLDGDTHVGKATSGTDESHAREAVQRMHPQMQITVFRPLKDHGELIKRKEELEMDPNHTPMNGIDLKEAAAQSIASA